MGLEARFSRSDLSRMFESRRKMIEGSVVRRLEDFGEELVAHARNYGSYKDQTGNLRASISFVILVNGRLVADTTKDGLIEDGLLTEIKSRYNSGYALVIVAGMNYAAAVESKNLNVLSATEIFANSKLPAIKSSIIKFIESAK